MGYLTKIMTQRRPVRFLMSRLLLRLRLRLPWTVCYNKKYNVRLHFTPMPIVHKTFLSGEDTLTEHLFSRFIEPESVVFDVGANVGTHALLAAKLATDGTVYAFEPGREAFKDLLDNIVLNAVPHLVPVFGGVGEAAGTVELYEHRYSNEKNFLLTGNAQDATKQGRNRVPVYRLDNIMACQSLACVDFLKIDVEGMELEVLRSLGERITDVRTIYFEYTKTNYQRYGHRLNEVCDLLRDAGFHLYAPRLEGTDLIIDKLPELEEERPVSKNLIAAQRVLLPS